MYTTCIVLLEALLLTAALSTDAFVSSLAYGASRIRIPLSSVAIISLICSGMLVASVTVGQLISPLIPSELTGTICFILLFLLGLLKLFDGTLKTLVSKLGDSEREIHFSISQLRFILTVYANPEAADRDASRELSPGEAVSLAIALSLDGLAVGFGAGLVSIHLAAVAGASLIMSAGAVLLGFYLGNRLAAKLSTDLGWLSGLMLVALAFLKR